MKKVLLILAGLAYLFMACASTEKVSNSDGSNSKSKADAAYEELEKETGKKADQ